LVSIGQSGHLLESSPESAGLRAIVQVFDLRELDAQEFIGADAKGASELEDGGYGRKPGFVLIVGDGALCSVRGASQLHLGESSGLPERSKPLAERRLSVLFPWHSEGDFKGHVRFLVPLQEERR
jgi:hypothetical protein